MSVSVQQFSYLVKPVLYHVPCTHCCCRYWQLLTCLILEEWHLHPIWCSAVTFIIIILFKIRRLEICRVCLSRGLTYHLHLWCWHTLQVQVSLFGGLLIYTSTSGANINMQLYCNPWSTGVCHPPKRHTLARTPRSLCLPISMQGMGFH